MLSTGRPSLGRIGIAARVDPRQAERVDAGPGGEGVAAEVEGVGLARLHGLGDDARRPRREQPGADPGQEAAARGVARERVERLADPVPLRHQATRRQARAARLGGRQHALELGQVVERSLGEHRAVRIERDRERAARDRAARSRRPRRRPRRRSPRDSAGSSARVAIAGSSPRQTRQPSEVKTASASPRLGSPAKRSIRSTRSPSSGPSSGISSAAAGPRRSRSIPTSRASARTATARPRQHEAARPRARARATRRSTGCAAGRNGSAAKHAASTRLRATERPADGRARAEAGARRAGPPAQDRADERRGEHRQQRGREPGRLVAAGDDPDREAELDGDQERPGDPAQSLALDRRRSPARPGSRPGSRASAPPTLPGRAPSTKRATSPNTPLKLAPRPGAGVQRRRRLSRSRPCARSAAGRARRSPPGP